MFSNLTEALAISPFLHLVPTQDLAPLIATSNISAQLPDAQDSTIENERILSDAVAAHLDESIDASAQAFGKDYANFDHSDLKELVFAKPVIAGSSERLPDLSNLLQSMKLLLPTQEFILDTQLVETAAGSEPHLATQMSWSTEIEIELTAADSEAFIYHSSAYRLKFWDLWRSNLKRSNPSANRMGILAPRKRSHMSLRNEDSLMENAFVEIHNAFAKRSLEGIQIHKLTELNQLVRVLSGTKIPEATGELLREMQGLCLAILSSEHPEKDSSLPVFQKTSRAGITVLSIMNLNESEGFPRDLLRELALGYVITFLQQSLVNSNCRNLFSAPETQELLDELEQQVSQVAIDEICLSKIEYFCINSLFQTPNNHTRDWIDSVLRVLVTTFKTYPSQRSFIVNELLTQYRAYPFPGRKERAGSNLARSEVLFLTLFLVRLIQTFDVSGTSKLLKESRFSEIANLLSVVKSRAEPLIDLVDSAYFDCELTCHQIADFFLESFSSADALYKDLLEFIVTELVQLLTMPEMPGAGHLLVSLMSDFMKALSSNSIPFSHHPFVLDLLGGFGIRCLELKTTLTEKLKKEPSTEMSNNHEILELYDHELSSVNLLASRDGSSRFQFLLLKALNVASRTLKKSISDDSAASDILSEGIPICSEKTLLALKTFERFACATRDGRLSQVRTRLNSIVGGGFLDLLFFESLELSYESFIALLATSLESPRVKVSAKAIRVLIPLVRMDSTILLTRGINMSLSRVLREGSALSKDAVVDLLGQYMFSSETLLKRYFSLIGEQSADQSILVRKRVLKIMEKIAKEASEVEIKAFACTHIICRFEDVDISLTEKSKVILLDILLGLPDATVASNLMIELANSSTLGRIFADFISDSSWRSPAIGLRYTVLRNIFEVTLDLAVELIEANLAAETSRSLRLVAILAENDENLISQDHLITLRPYLTKSENLDVRKSALRIMRLSIPRLKAVRPEFASSLQADILQKLTAFDIDELHDAVQIINQLTKLTEKEALTKAAISTLVMLRETLASVSAQVDAKCCKLINLLGCFASYCDFERQRENFVNAQIGLKENETIASLTTRYLLTFFRMGSQAIRVNAIRNLIHIATFNPQLFLSENVLLVLDSGFETDDRKLKCTIVSGLSKYFDKEDEIARSKVTEEGPTQKFMVANVKLSLAESVCCGVAQRYIEKVILMCNEGDIEASESCVSFLQSVLTMGFANPKSCIATLISLEASPSKRVKKIAYRLHSDIFEKHESLADRSYAEAVRLAVRHGGGANQDPLFLRTVYKVVNRAYSAKKKFISSVCKLFDVNVGEQELIKAVEQRNVVIFTAKNLVVLNFTSLEEICVVLYHLDRCVTRQGTELTEKLSAAIGSVDGDGMSPANLQLLFVLSQTVLALLFLRQTLATSYGVRGSTMDTFRPSRPDVELRQAPKIMSFVNFPDGELDLGNSLGQPASFGPIFTRLVHSIRNFIT